MRIVSPNRLKLFVSEVVDKNVIRVKTRNIVEPRLRVELLERRIVKSVNEVLIGGGWRHILNVNCSLDKILLPVVVRLAEFRAILV